MNTEVINSALGAASDVGEAVTQIPVQSTVVEILKAVKELPTPHIVTMGVVGVSIVGVLGYWGYTVIKSVADGDAEVSWGDGGRSGTYGPHRGPEAI